MWSKFVPLNTIALELVPPNLERGVQYPVDEARKVLALAAETGIEGRIQHVMIPGMIDEDDDRPIEMEPRMDVLDYWNILRPELPGLRGLCT
ncbi:mycobacterial-type methylenetetrahydrofolate reductase, partial [Agromyces sp. NPDC055657]